MAANNISQLTTANTFQHWLTATQSLIGTANLLTNGAGSTFYANTRLEIGGTNATLNVVTGATINTVTSNTTNTINLEARTVNITNNVTSDLRLTNDLYVGDALKVYGNAEIDGNTLISGDLTVSGNITLDAIGFDDLIVNGSGSFANTLSVTGISTLSNVIVTGNVATLNVTSNTVTQNLRVDQTSNFIGDANFGNVTLSGVLTANQWVGTGNTAIYSELERISGDSLAFSIALG